MGGWYVIVFVAASFKNEVVAVLFSLHIIKNRRCVGTLGRRRSLF